MLVDLLGVFLMILVGVSLGLIGSGGSILTVPILVYLFKLDPITATTYELFIVGVSSLFGFVSYLKQGDVRFSHILEFGLPSIITIFLTRKYVLPAIPLEMHLGAAIVSKNLFIMVLFSFLMLVASYSMIKGRKEPSDSDAQSIRHLSILLLGAFVGFLTGMVGVGGGFLIIPALTIWGKLPMKQAVGTSLAIIVFKSASGFLGSLGTVVLDWKFLFSVTAIAILGIFIGVYLSCKIDGKKLKPIFGWFILLMGVYIIIRELLLK